MKRHSIDLLLKEADALVTAISSRVSPSPVSPLAPVKLLRVYASALRRADRRWEKWLLEN